MTTKPTYPASQTLYVSNLNDKIRKDDLRLSLYTLFSTYGCVLDVNALKSMKCRGQAHIAFRDVASAAQAMRALNGMNVFGKEMRIAYAKSKSHAIAKLDGTFKMPTTGPSASGEVAAVPFVPLPSAPADGGAASTAAVGQKRQREEESDEEEAMDVEDDDE